MSYICNLSEEILFENRSWNAIYTFILGDLVHLSWPLKGLFLQL